ncbi:MAG TPA: copper transporter [Limnochordales bacterium]
MLIDIRYHLASLIGVFLALGIGMLIGTQLAQSGTLENEQLRLAQRLEASLEGLRAENRGLREAVASLEGELAAEREFADLVLTALAAGQLVGTAVDVYVPSGQAAAAERMQRLLAATGASLRVHAAQAPQAAVPPAAAAAPSRPASPGPAAAGDGAAQAAEEADRAAIVVWAEGWEVGGGPAPWPAGAVLAVPGSGAAARRAPAAVGLAGDVIEAVDTPWGLFALVERLRTGQAPSNAKEALRRRFVP